MRHFIDVRFRTVQKVQTDILSWIVTFSDTVNAQTYLASHTQNSFSLLNKFYRNATWN